MEEWNDYDEDDDESRPVWKRPVFFAALAAVVIALIGIGYVVLNKSDGSSDDAAAVSTTVASAASTPASAAATPTTAAGSTSPSTAAPTSTAAPATVAPTTGATTTAATTTEPSTSTTDTEAPSTEAPTTAAGASPNPVTYATLPDGTPAPVIAVFGTDSNTLTGNVPDQASKDKLQALMIAYSKTPVPVNNLLTIDPTVPPNVGVRVVELTSARFEPNSSKVEGFHALELDRIVSVMGALPNISALIIGHADQIGSDAQNFKISAERATAVVNYLVSKGVAPSRLSSRAVGDTDLLTLNDDAASLALNRRTEIVFYGLLSS